MWSSPATSYNYLSITDGKLLKHTQRFGLRIAISNKNLDILISLLSHNVLTFLVEVFTIYKKGIFHGVLPNEQWSVPVNTDRDNDL